MEILHARVYVPLVSEAISRHAWRAFDGRWILLGGPMGSGKSTLGRPLAARLGRPFVDLDARVEAEAGHSIAALFEREGEEGFRRREADALRRTLAERPSGVLALGGGSLVDPVSRRLVLIEDAFVFGLEAPRAVLEARAGGDVGRPLAGRLSSLLEARADVYAEVHARIDSTRELPRQVEAALEALERDPLRVPLGRRSYRVDVGRGVRARLPEEATSFSGRLLVTDHNVHGPWGADLARDAHAGPALVLPPGEVHKTLETVERIWDAALERPLDRRGVVLGVGGGVVGDLTGFAAATLLRGVAFGLVPTSLLAMVDASVGGKTGFDRPQGKNLVGAFHQPRFVLCDLDTLSTLPPVELRAGMAEVLKAAWLEGEEAVVALEAAAEGVRRDAVDLLEPLVRRAVRLKVRVVADDEREAGARRLLNLGHTVGHAIEAAAGFGGLRHGEAVGLGLLAACRVAAGLGDPDAAAHEARMARILRALGLPTDLDRRLDDGSRRFLSSDKKRHGDAVHFIVPGDPGRTRIETLPLAEVERIVWGPEGRA
jgi:shikimate kinase/3-dehydroquinate synthase